MELYLIAAVTVSGKLRGAFSCALVSASIGPSATRRRECFSEDPRPATRVRNPVAGHGPSPPGTERLP